MLKYVGIKRILRTADDNTAGGEGSGQPSKPQPTPSPDQSFHEEQLSDIPSSSQPQKTQKHRKGRKLSNRVLDLEKAVTAQAKEVASKGDCYLKEESQEVGKEEKIKNSRVKTLQDVLISEEDDFYAGFDVVRDEGITHVEGDAEQVVIAAVEVVNAAEPKTPPTTTTTILLEDDDVTVAATLV
ncbi:hypothetical protein Tco_0021034 [Tanacetum coccineum]